jgi:hypothetical protein
MDYWITLRLLLFSMISYVIARRERSERRGRATYAMVAYGQFGSDTTLIQSILMQSMPFTYPYRNHKKKHLGLPCASKRFFPVDQTS